MLKFKCKHIFSGLSCPLTVLQAQDRTARCLAGLQLWGSHICPQVTEGMHITPLAPARGSLLSYPLGGRCHGLTYFPKWQSHGQCPGPTGCTTCHTFGAIKQLQESCCHIWENKITFGPVITTANDRSTKNTAKGLVCMNVSRTNGHDHQGCEDMSVGGCGLGD